MDQNVSVEEVLNNSFATIYDVLKLVDSNVNDIVVNNLNNNATSDEILRLKQFKEDYINAMEATKTLQSNIISLFNYATKDISEVNQVEMAQEQIQENAQIEFNNDAIQNTVETPVTYEEVPVAEVPVEEQAVDPIVPDVPVEEAVPSEIATDVELPNPTEITNEIVADDLVVPEITGNQEESTEEVENTEEPVVEGTNDVVVPEIANTQEEVPTEEVENTEEPVVEETNDVAVPEIANTQEEVPTEEVENTEEPVVEETNDVVVPEIANTQEEVPTEEVAENTEEAVAEETNDVVVPEIANTQEEVPTDAVENTEESVVENNEEVNNNEISFNGLESNQEEQNNGVVLPLISVVPSPVEETATPDAPVVENTVDDPNALKLYKTSNDQAKVILVTNVQYDKLKQSLDSKKSLLNAKGMFGGELEEQLVQNGLLEGSVEDKQQQVQQLIAEAQELYKEGKSEEAQEKMNQVAALNEEIKNSAQPLQVAA